MRYGGLLKTLFPVVSLVVVLAVIFGAVHFKAAAAGIETAQTRTFFGQFVIAGGPIVWFVLLPMSLLTGYLMAVNCIIIRRKNLLPCTVAENLIAAIKAGNGQRLKDVVPDNDDLVSTAVRKAVVGSGADWLRIGTAISESLQEQACSLLRKIEWLSMIGNVSPMVGLFGTVFGMIKLFNTIVSTGGQPQPAQLAGGISVALVTTFWGLFIAIPALAAYGIFRNRIETIVSDAVEQTEQVSVFIRRYIRKQQNLSKKPVKTLNVKSV